MSNAIITQEPNNMNNISPFTRDRIATFITEGGQRLADWEMRIARRALKLAHGDADDAAALILLAR